MGSPEIIHKQHFRGSAGCIYILVHSDRYLHRQKKDIDVTTIKKEAMNWGGEKSWGGK